MATDIYVVEDNDIVREMLVEFLNSVGDFEVCGSAATAEEAFDRLAHVDADLVLIDMALPGMSGAELVDKLLGRTPSQLCLMYSGHREISYAEQALAFGARGYLLKGAPEELPSAIRAVLNGEIFLSEELRQEGV